MLLQGAKPRRFVAVAGNIGAGKSTLVTWLCQTYGFRPFMEPNALNPYLSDFYADMGRWAFHSQISFLSHKFRLHMELMAEPNTVVQDRTIYEDAEIFARNLYRGRYMKKRDYQTYTELYETMKQALQPPDLLIYLRCDVRNIRQRIKRRGRASEQNIPLSYVKRLNSLYEEWIDSYTVSPLLVWNSGNKDYLSDLGYNIEFRRAIERFL